MVNTQLLQYIREALAIGVERDEIRKDLLNVGWLESDIDEAFTIIRERDALIRAVILGKKKGKETASGPESNATGRRGTASIGPGQEVYRSPAIRSLPAKVNKKVFTASVLTVAVLAAGGLGAWYWWISAEPTPLPEAPATGVKIEPEAVNTANGSTELTAGWKTYRNHLRGFVLRYPPSLTAGVTPRTPAFQSIVFSDLRDPKRPAFTVEITATTSTAPTVVEWADHETWPFPDSWKNHFSTTTTPGNIIALQDTVSSSVWMKNGNALYYIKNGVSGEDKALFEQPVFDAILNSFAFFEPIDVSDWKTYVSKTYAFTFQYPGGWKTVIYPNQKFFDTPAIRVSKEGRGINIFINPPAVDVVSEEKERLEEMSFRVPEAAVSHAALRGREGNIYRIEATIHSIKLDSLTSDSALRLFAVTDHADAPEELREYEQIFSTFTFPK